MDVSMRFQFGSRPVALPILGIWNVLDNWSDPWLGRSRELEAQAVGQAVLSLSGPAHQSSVWPTEF